MDRSRWKGSEIDTQMYNFKRSKVICSYYKSLSKNDKTCYTSVLDFPFGLYVFASQVWPTVQNLYTKGDNFQQK